MTAANENVESVNKSYIIITVIILLWNLAEFI